MIHRLIELPKKQSFFLFGPRQTGKSTLIDDRYAKDVWKINLLLNEPFFKYSRNPSLFGKEAAEKVQNEKIRTIFVDEIQRIPALLNEVQFLIDKFGCQFILTGSSARKLKRGGANLLGGRAVERHLFPFVYAEIKDSFKLDDIMMFGSLPALAGKNKAEKEDILSAYAHIYLREEIQNEGIVRNLGGFSRFLDMAADQCGELVSFSAVGRECHLPVRTVQSYYEILEDTLIGFRLQSWNKSFRKRLVAHPKFYFFDLGVTNAVVKRLTGSIDSVHYGRLFEQFIILETYRMISYFKSETNLYFWRTNHGAEVDLLLEKHGKIIGAFEIKSTTNVAGAHLSGIRSFHEEHPKVPCFVICRSENSYTLNQVKILPWRKYLETLDEWL